MNGLQIVNFLSLDPFTGQIFGGLAMQDSPELPGLDRKKVMYVLNTDVLQGEGEHWCLVYFDEDREEFFDPFGNPPGLYGFDHLLRKRSQTKRRCHNKTCVQDLLGVSCGAHCLFFGFHRSRGKGMKDIVKMYHRTDLKANDAMVIDFVHDFGKSYQLKL